MFLILKLLVFYIWCCDGMRLGVQVMSACLVDVSVGVTTNFKQSDMF